MKSIIAFLAMILLSIINCSGQETPIVCKYSAWPAGVTDNNVTLKGSQAVTIILTEIEENEVKIFLENSLYEGQFAGNKVSNTKFSALSAIPNVISYNATTKILKITLRPDLLNITNDDFIKLSLNVGVDTTKRRTINITRDSETSILAENTLNPECLRVYKSNVLDNLYIKFDIGFKNKSDRYSVHIFFDQFGNYLFGSKPAGIERKYHYVIHVLYSISDSTIYHFTVETTGGTLSDNMSIYNAATDPVKPTTNSNTVKGKNFSSASLNCQGLVDEEFNIFPTSDNLTFDLKVIPKENGKIKPVIKIQTYVITKTPFYYGAFTAGLFGTFLSNPTFQLTTLPNGTTPPTQTVKITDEGASVNATFMYTIYFSLYNVIFPHSELGNDNSYRYNSWGRSYLDDEKNIFRKIYPAIGIGLNGSVLTNWYVGFNIEPMKGFGIFVGQNIRKVSTFDMPNFTMGTSTVTQDQFNFYQNSKLKSGWALGITLDLSILSKLTSGANPPHD